MNTPQERARHFLENEKAFRLGMLPTECSHPKTAALSGTIAASITDGVRMLMSVDEDIPPAMARVLAMPAFTRLVDALTEAIGTGKRVVLTGCGATGRLAILLEAAWRAFWQELGEQRPQWRQRLPNIEDAVLSLMAGGDYALIRSVEGFEDSTDLGRFQLTRAGVGPGDVVVAVTEGGETSFVIGTAWQGLQAGANVFFVYNNPTDVLHRHVERSRAVIDEPRITKIDLYTGPMAIAGSTRMQATTAELLAVGAALELALSRLLARWLAPEELRQAGIPVRSAGDYSVLFAGLIEQLRLPQNVDAIAGMIAWEESLYGSGGLVTYLTDRFLIDVLTDTTERAPTFRLPPFRKAGDTTAVPSWAFVKNPCCTTEEAWGRVLRRPPRGIDWPASVYQSLDVAPSLRDCPPRLDNAEIYRFQIGNEPDASRYEVEPSGLAMILVGNETAHRGPRRALMDEAFASWAPRFTKTAVLAVGPARPDCHAGDVFHVGCELPASTLDLWHRLAVKLALNLMSTATMARLGRVEGNYMSRVETTNKKLVDRGTRLVSHLAGVDYETACYALHEAMHLVAEREQTTRDAPSPVTVAVERLRNGQG
ncbi:MAG: hypothetical protein RBS80_27230 [Thermoguttaceae bacterium]|jgi:N-acetylmuramic acid 6-phosphate etherase|nr:hypothetical protein [Thermoguttaceae bacterium]